MIYHYEDIRVHAYSLPSFSLLMADIRCVHLIYHYFTYKTHSDNLFNLRLKGKLLLDLNFVKGYVCTSFLASAHEIHFM